MLEVENLNVFHGSVQAVRNVSINVGKGEIVGIVGVNGAGKTSLLMGIIGLLPKTGRISFKNKEISELSTSEISRLGLEYMPEDRRIYPKFTVEENLKIPILVRKSSEAKIEKTLNNVYKLFPRLKEMRERMGRHLSGGEQKILALGRAFATEPSFLLLDETFEGLSGDIRNQIIGKIRERVEREELGLIMAESKVELVSELAEKVYKIERGSLSKEPIDFD